MDALVPELSGGMLALLFAAALLVCIAAGHILRGLGLLMMLGQAIGAWLGAHSLLRIDPRWLRVLVVVMSLAMLGRYLIGSSKAPSAREGAGLLTSKDAQGAIQRLAHMPTRVPSD